jgi:hypothetical protein
MSRVDIIDEMFVVADRSLVRTALCDPTTWGRWFPEVRLTTSENRDLDGVRWNVSGALVGTAEVWLEEFGDGTLVHTYIRTVPASTRRFRSRRQARVLRHYALPLKRHLLSVKDDLEKGRTVGEPRVALAERVVSRPIETDDVRAARDGRPDDLEHTDRR